MTATGGPDFEHGIARGLDAQDKLLSALHALQKALEQLESAVDDVVDRESNGRSHA